MGALGVVSACLVLSFYSVVAGWAFMYLRGAIDGTLWTLVESEYGRFFTEKISAGWHPVFWHLVVMSVTGAVVAGGVRGGIEAFNSGPCPERGP